MQHVILISQKVQSLENKRQRFLTLKGESSHFHERKRANKDIGLFSQKSFVVDVFSPLDIHGNISCVLQAPAAQSSC